MIQRKHATGIRLRHAAVLAGVACSGPDKFDILPCDRHAGCPASFADRSRCKDAISWRS